ncbi:hypothetical protein AAVH_06039 [Aphelenchoides avenae]|nr:hypothetical protein AAVH_06039 [Aphelenchus avenae]
MLVLPSMPYSPYASVSAPELHFQSTSSLSSACALSAFAPRTSDHRIQRQRLTKSTADKWTQTDGPCGDYEMRECDWRQHCRSLANALYAMSEELEREAAVKRLLVV